MRPYSEKAAYYTRQRLVWMIVTFTISFICVVTIGAVTGNWLWGILILVIYFVIAATVANLMKDCITKNQRASHFLLACQCRALNNRIYLRHGIELRPGYLGKWLEVKAFQMKSRKKYLYYVEERVLSQDLTKVREELDLETKKNVLAIVEQ